mmetsp:Transcript_20169/g.28794  ORF Transcript_20169/g.28794 Transcript_20169/m.28794 type:complete len:512 (-) Transcript_20169:48-1583(-)
MKMAFSKSLSLLCIALPTLAFNNLPFLQRNLQQRTLHLSAVAGNNLDSVDVTVKATELDDSLGLSPEEKTVVNIHRVCSPAVVYVTSVLSSSSPVSSARSRRRKKNTEKRNDPQKEKKNQLPNGMSLGSGSGFVIDSEGYIVTNYHVVQRAYESNQAVLQYEKFWDDLAKNTTKNIKEKLSFSSSNVIGNVEGVLNRTVTAITGRENNNGTEVLPAGIFVRFGENGDTDGSVTSYYSCEIVDVKKELDIAVLKIMDSSDKMNNLLKPMDYGSSSNLVVGQSLLAIGNPFGLDRTITSGLVSATGRSVTGVAGNQIKNCIQTDCAINPGNSGGPLLNLKGEVVGVNTMIISASGSSSGIGFAVPGDSVKESADKIIELDKQRRLRTAKRKGRGWLGAAVATSSLEQSLRKRLLSASLEQSKNSGQEVGAFITSIDTKSPLMTQEGVSITSITNGNVEIGDRIVSVGGNVIENAEAFVTEMKGRVEGENLSLTIENVGGERRVVYVTLGQIPL